MQEISQDIQDNIKIIFVESFDEVIVQALEKKIDIVPDESFKAIRKNKRGKFLYKY